MMAIPGLDADKSLLWQEELTEIILLQVMLFISASSFKLSSRAGISRDAPSRFQNNPLSGPELPPD